MIFITDKQHENKLFTGWVNKIIERDGKNGGKIKTYVISTNEKKQDESREYSSWFCGVIGDARKNESLLTEGTRINVYGMKLTNVSKKMPDGTFSKPFFNFVISDFEVANSQQNNQHTNNTEQTESMPY